MTQPPRPLDGIRVLELGQLLAGPFAGALLGYFGAEVIKVEPPGRGDPIRSWRLLDAGTSVWWRSLARNKKCVTLDLHTTRGRELARRLIERSDVLIENFRPGRMEEWGLGPRTFEASNPRLVYARVSGFGQTGPGRSKPGFAAVCEAAAGLRHLIGHPGEAPVRANLSLGDSLGGLHAAFGILLALRQRDIEGRGQVVDVALTESVFNVLESVVPELHRFGHVRPPAGTALTGIVPSNAFRCGDGKWVVIGANANSVFIRLMKAVGREDLAADPALATNPGRVARAAELDDVIGTWTLGRPSDEVVSMLEAAEVPVGPINDARAVSDDPHFRARGLFELVETPTGPLEIPALAPRLERTPGRSDWAGPELGAHNAEVYQALLGLDAAELDELHESGVI
jgi:crotonobetainyl-CoA:carnitine CoA-transferase CaiB-like acyl-CoA transferase